LYSSLNIINVMKPRRVRWATHVSHTYNILVGILKERYCFEDFGLDGRIIWKRTVKTQGVKCGLGTATAIWGSVYTVNRPNILEKERSFLIS
jgi:hypothetical protein